MARKKKKKRGHDTGAEHETRNILAETLRLQTRTLALLGERGCRSRSRSRRSAAPGDVGNTRRAVLTPRAEVHAQPADTCFPPRFPPPPQLLPAPPPPPFPMQTGSYAQQSARCVGQGWDAYTQQGGALDEHFARLVAQEIWSLKQENEAMWV